MKKKKCIFNAKMGLCTLQYMEKVKCSLKYFEQCIGGNNKIIINKLIQ